MFTCIIGPNLELRPVEPRFAEEMYSVAIANRDYLRPFMSWVDKTQSVEDTKKHIADSMEGWVKGTDLNTTIWEAGRFIGSAGYHNILRRRRQGEIGYWLAEHAQGRGIMTRAVAALVTYGFTGLDLHRIEIRCDPVNVKSRAIPKRLGFTEEGTARESLERFDGKMVDGVVYSLLAHEWKGIVG